MTTRVFLRDVLDSKGEVKWPAGAVADLHPNVWSSICDQLGVTLTELTAPADGVSPTEMTGKLAERDAEIKALRAAYKEATGQDFKYEKAPAPKVQAKAETAPKAAKPKTAKKAAPKAKTKAAAKKGK